MIYSKNRSSYNSLQNQLVIIMDLQKQTQQPILAANRLKELSSSTQNCLVEDLVQQFLDNKALCTSNISLTQAQELKGKNEAIQHQKDISSLLPAPKQPASRKKSIFHNFQKHLITLLKKQVKINGRTLPDTASRELCQSLWQYFIKSHSFNKHVLHMIFGIATHKDISAEFAKIAEKYPTFGQICGHYDPYQIAAAQTILREQAARQMEQVSKQKLRSNCSVQKFEVFYEYLHSFRLQIMEGPITSRMLKSRKSQVIAKLCEADQNE